MKLELVGGVCGGQHGQHHKWCMMSHQRVDYHIINIITSVFVVLVILRVRWYDSAEKVSD